MKSLMRLLDCVLADASIWCSTSTTRDLETITRRVDHEGLSFLTISLPSFCQDFEKSLDDGMVATSRFMGFHKRGALPVFLRGLLSRVFDASTGVLVDEPDPLAVHAVRQVCLLFKKVLLPCSPERERKAYASFIHTDNSVRAFHDSYRRAKAFANASLRLPEKSCASGTSHYERPDFLQDSSTKPEMARGIDSISVGRFLSVSKILWSSVMGPVSLRVRSHAHIPRHGPGATAERISGNRKFTFSRWHQRLEPYFPSDLFVIPNWNFIDVLSDIEFVGPEAEQPVRVISVPKTLKTPRIIAIEPVCVQYAQQSLLAEIVSALESHRFTSGSVNFTDQTINQQLALSSSSDGAYATIDLKDASDRVSSLLVYDMLSSVPDLRDAIFACRSTRADVPGYGVHHLARFASMGSALCFPIEAMVFYTIAISAILECKGLRVSPTNIMNVGREVRVYGDDIIVPVDYVQTVKDELERFNLQVNVNKTFGTGKFRESCGLDAYGGVPVTPVYCRRLPPTSRRNVPELVSWVSLSNQLYKAGYWKASSYARSVVERLAHVPYTTENSAALGFYSYLGYECHSWSTTLHKWLVKAPVLVAELPNDHLSDHGALLKCFLKRGLDPYADARHLERYGRPVAVYTKRRWASPY